LGDCVEKRTKPAGKRIRPPVPPSIATDSSITEKLPQLVESLMQLAIGVTIEKETQQGKQVYALPPNRLAAEYLINRVLGKPTERTQSSNTESFDEMDSELKELRKLTTDELVELHRKTIGEG
jgi:hypothetical protein